MCGIVGVSGRAGAPKALDVVLGGLRRLEYRGYDSAGVALVDADGIHVTKRSGRLARLVDAVTARLIPTDHDPGAREARVVRFIDRYLSGTGFIYASADGGGFLRLEGKESDAWQQRVVALQQRYREGLRALQSVSDDMFGRPFIELDDVEVPV